LCDRERKEGRKRERVEEKERGKEKDRERKRDSSPQYRGERDCVCARKRKKGGGTEMKRNRENQQERQNCETMGFCKNEGTQQRRGGGLGSRPKKMYGERLGDGVEYHLMKPTPRR